MRPTIRDVARKAGVSLATVDRVLNSRVGVRSTTQSRVVSAMEELGYERDIAAANLSRRREYRLRFIVPEGPNAFMRGIEAEIEALRRPIALERVRLELETVPAFDGPALAAALNNIDPSEIDGVAVVAADAPLVRGAIADLRGKGVHVVTLVSDLPSSSREHFIGIDNVAAGRTAAGLLGRFCRSRPGCIALVAGSMIVRDHVERRMGFEQVIRADFPDLDVLPAIEALDDAGRVERLLTGILSDRGDIVGIYNLGAGNRGLVRALTSAPPERRPAVVVHEVTEHTREALANGLFDAAIHQDWGHEVRSAVRVLKALVDGRPFAGAQERIRVEIFLRDNLS